MKMDVNYRDIGPNFSHLQSVATHLDQAVRQATEVTQFSQEEQWSLEDAYRIQRLGILKRCEAGEQVIGVKLGFTSRSKMVQMGVHHLIWGWLTNTMLEEDGGHVNLERFIHPRVEPEICFLLKRELSSPITMLEAVDYLEAAAPALEIIDSRYRAFKFNLQDVVADNCSSAGLTIGPWSRDFDKLANAGVVLRINGQIREMGSTAAILGQPLRSLVQTSQLLSKSGLSLPAGSIIMAGAATAAVALTDEAHIGVNVCGLGESSFTTYRPKAL